MGHFQIHRIGDLLVISAVTAETAGSEEERREPDVDVDKRNATEEPAFPRRITLRGWSPARYAKR